MIKPKVEKLHVLAVLEDGSSLDAHGVKRRLREYFGLDCRINSLRKNLRRCCDQRILTRMKIGRSYRYWISRKGGERLKIVRAKRRKASEKKTDVQRFPGGSETRIEISVFDRWLEVTNALMFCDTESVPFGDNVFSSLVSSARTYWMREFYKLIPHLPDYLVSATGQFLRQIRNYKTLPKDNVLDSLLRKRKSDEESAYFFWRGEKDRNKNPYREINMEYEKSNGLSKEAFYGKLVCNKIPYTRYKELGTTQCPFLSRKSLYCSVPVIPAKVLEIMRETLTELSEHAIWQKETKTEEQAEEKESWEDLNSWWRHLA